MLLKTWYGVGMYLANVCHRSVIIIIITNQYINVGQRASYIGLCLSYLFPDHKMYVITLISPVGDYIVALILN